ncbi:MAG TPA: hypothetical protein PKA63_02435 [Oligoflexia bacterium]|nr:hypothetical protein [Oligoflexia bacterium]HMP47509.1 hypothetical protein [Oligoflexia bacterium]
MSGMLALGACTLIIAGAKALVLIERKRQGSLCMGYLGKDTTPEGLERRLKKERY